MMLTLSNVWLDSVNKYDYMILPYTGGFRWLDGFDVFVSPDAVYADQFQILC